LKKTQLTNSIPAGFARESLSAKYNEIMSVQRLFKRHLKEIAAVIVELICGNMGMILPLKILVHSFAPVSTRQFSG
jgi:glutamate-1-semialdehyde aminotransferase